MDREETVRWLLRGTEYGSAEWSKTAVEEITAMLDGQRPLTAYVGFDHTAPSLHIGHLVPLMGLKRFAEQGFDTVVVLGTYTGQIGDGAGREKARSTTLDEETALENAGKIADQVFQVVPGVRVLENHGWLNGDWVMRYAHLFSVQEILIHGRFNQRREAGERIGLNEFLYPILQGTDAAVLGADVQLGATEQLFNICAGRAIQKHHGLNPCTPVLYPVLLGTDGHKRMSKSEGNTINLDEEPLEMFSKVMAISDETMEQWWPFFVRDVIFEDPDPMERKKFLAATIVQQVHEDRQDRIDNPEKDLVSWIALREWERIHQEGEPPTNWEYVTVDEDMPLVAFISKAADVSLTQARRLIDQGGVRVNGDAVDWLKLAHLPNIKPGDRVQVGKKRFFEAREVL